MLTVITDAILPFFRATARSDDSGTRPNGVIRYIGPHVRGGIGRCVRMTTFEDSDLFTEVFHDFRSVGSARRRSVLVGPTAMVLAAGLVVAGFVWARGGPLLTDHTVDASTLLPQFAAGQTAGGPAAVGRPERARRRRAQHPFPHRDVHRPALRRRRDLGQALRRHRPGRRPAGGQLHGPHVDGTRPVDETLLVVASSGPVPAAASGWREAGPDVFVND